MNGTVQHAMMDDGNEHGSSLHSRLKTEFDEVMSTSMQRRLSRLREEVDVLFSTLQTGTTPNGCGSHKQAASASSASATAGPDTKPLCETVAKAMRRANKCRG